MQKTQINTFFKILKDSNPNPTTELVYSSPFELLISVILSAQATDMSVNKATKTLFESANSPETMLKLGEENLIKQIKSIGLYKTKAKNILKTCLLLIEKHQNQIPNNFSQLIELPGVGRKTANVVLNTIFNQPTIAVDTHIFRVSNRTGIAVGKNANEVESKLMQVVPKKYIHDAHHLLILHGRYVCKAKKPICSTCKVYNVCERNL